MKIPAPSSFSTCNSVSPSATTSTDQSTKVTLPLKKEWLAQLEIALQLYMSQTKRNRISYRQFCVLAPKLQLEMNHEVSAIEDTTGISKTLLQLSTGERLWHDLSCVAIPFLYQWVSPRKDSPPEDFSEIQVVPFSGNRQVELQRLLRQADHGIDGSQSNQVLEWLLSLREKTITTSGSSMSTPPSPLLATQDTADSIPNVPQEQRLTLEQRVRLKAERKAKLFATRSNQANTDAGAASSTTDDLVSLADALFAHARHVLRQQARRQKKPRIPRPESPSSSQCIIPWKDLTIPGYTRANLQRALTTMATRCPDWISMKKSTRTTGSATTTTTLVVMDTSQYKVARAKLLGQELTASSSAPQSLLPASSPGRQPMRVR